MEISKLDINTSLNQRQFKRQLRTECDRVSVKVPTKSSILKICVYFKQNKSYQVYTDLSTIKQLLSSTPEDEVQSLRKHGAEYVGSEAN